MLDGWGRSRGGAGPPCPRLAAPLCLRTAADADDDAGSGGVRGWRPTGARADRTGVPVHRSRRRGGRGGVGCQDGAAAGSPRHGTPR